MASSVLPVYIPGQFETATRMENMPSKSRIGDILPEQQFKEPKPPVSNGDSDNGTAKSDDTSVESLAELQHFLESDIPEQPSAQFLSDAAHELVDKLNTKRKIDNQLIERFRQAMESQTAKMVEQLEHHLSNTYDTLNCQVNEKLHELFECVNKIATTEGELENFRESLRMFYQEIQDV